MIKDVKTGEFPCTLKIKLSSPKKEKIWIKVCDAKATKTFYSKRYSRFEGEQSFYIGMPESPEFSRVVIYRQGEDPETSNSFKVSQIEILPLKHTRSIGMSRKTRSFVKFAQEFSEECSYLDASKKGEPYLSNNRKFRIDYFDKIRSRKTGKVIGTPARISQLNGRIEVSKEAFKRYSVPMRMAILLHEFSHFYLNNNPSSEVEADLRALRIYLSMGYPRIDAYNVFLNVFKSASSAQSMHRFDELDNFIKNWDYGKRR